MMENKVERQRTACKKWRDKNKEKAIGSAKSWRAKNPGYHARWHAKNKVRNPILYVWRNCRNRAKRLGVPFDLELVDIVIPEFCPVLGVKLEWGRGLKTGLKAPNSPSIDRVIGERGYTKCNIRVISNRANLLKRDGTLAELKALVRYLES